MAIREKLNHDLVSYAAAFTVWSGLYAGATVVVGWVAGLKPFEKGVIENLGTMSSTLQKISGDVEEIKAAATVAAAATAAATAATATATEAKKGGWFNLF